MREITSRIFSLVVTFVICVVCVSAKDGASTPCEELTFAPPAYFNSGLGPRGLTTTDLNGDGNTDLVAANETANSVLVRFGDGHGNFPSSQLFSGSAPSGAVVADLNHDGKLDLVISHRSNSSITVRLGLGGGAFSSPVQTTVGSAPSGVIVADFNRDGNLDIATANRGSGNISVIFGNGAGAFGAASIFTTGALSSGIAVADLNGDGKPDLATANEGSNTITVRFNDGMGSFPTAATLASGVQPFFVVAADLDNDGDSDLVATNQGSSSLSVFRGDGHGAFAPRMDLSVKAAPRSLIAADLDADGAIDLAAGIGSSQIAVLLNGCAQNTPPTISSGVVTRQQDAASANSTIATVGDAEDGAESLAVTINGGASASENGVTVSNLSVSAAGNVTADVSASCGASDATFSLTVTDSEGLFATATLSVDVSFETTPPVINLGNPIPDITVYLPLDSSDNSVPVTFDLPKATDNCTASPTVTSEPVSGSFFDRGTTVVTVTASDELGNRAVATFNVRVLFNFGGFLQPIDPLPTLNIATGGSSIPVKFSLSGDKGLDILAIGYPASSPIPCDDTEPGSVIEETEPAGGTILSYDPVSDQYKYVWKTSKDWKRTCRMLILRLSDGSEYYAKFSFR